MRAGIALGANQGDRLLNIREARRRILELEGVQPPVLSSAIYETDPVDCEPGAPAFLNAAIEISSDHDPVRFIEQLKHIEVKLGRPAKHERNRSRPIDIDLLYFGDTVLKTDGLTLPHPRIAGRKFVLQPLADIRPELVLPGRSGTVRELLASAPQSVRVVRSAMKWEVE